MRNFYSLPRLASLHRRLMGFRVDYGAPLQSELHPQVRIGLDLGD